jgi:hypothetical protein
MTRKLIAFGALAGLAWAASLRGYMAELAGPVSHVGWFGTFVLILLPGLVVGAALGWAEGIRRTGGRRGWRWLAATPLIFPVLALTPPGALMTFLTTGVGGGSLAVVLTGMIGGYAISGRGPLWARIVTGVIALAGLVLGAIGAVFVRDELVLTEPRGAWVAVLGTTLTALLLLACSIPHRPVVTKAA